MGKEFQIICSFSQRCVRGGAGLLNEARAGVARSMLSVALAVVEGRVLLISSALTFLLLEQNPSHSVIFSNSNIYAS